MRPPMRSMGQTQLLGVIGWPVQQSRSPAMQNAALRELGLEEWSYVRFAVPPDRLAGAVEGAVALGVRGLNITIPHKEAALTLCAPDPLAREVGAVNTLVLERDSVSGTNTDVHGFRMLMAENGIQPGGRALVLGAGGAARAVVAALRTTGYGEIVVVSRKAEPLVVGDTRYQAQPWTPEVLARELARADRVVDSTPRGLDPTLPPIDLAPLRQHAAVIDLVVQRSTPLVADAHARGLKAATGTAMLLHQGAAALERWLSRPAPIDVMRAALEASLK